MSLVVVAMAVILFSLESKLLTTSAMVFTLVLLIPSLIVDLMVLFGPKGEPNDDPLASTYRGRNLRGRR